MILTDELYKWIDLGGKIALGTIGVDLAVRQASISHMKLRLDLLEQRRAVYNTAKKFLSEATTLGRLTNESQMELFAARSDCMMLFPRSVYIYLTKLLDDGIESSGMRVAIALEATEDNDAERQYIKARQRISGHYKRLERAFVPSMRIRNPVGIFGAIGRLLKITP